MKVTLFCLVIRSWQNSSLQKKDGKKTEKNNKNRWLILIDFDRPNEAVLEMRKKGHPGCKRTRLWRLRSYDMGVFNPS